MKIKYLIICAIAFSLMACENQENEFDDFGSTSVYFPFQTPVRTLIQGKYDLGFNENDNKGRFEIGVIMSGVYNNDIDRRVHFELAPDLIDASDLGLDTVNVKILPASYYTIEQESPVTIPSGSTKGRIPVQLSDAFFDDPQSFADFGEVHYVIPLRITDYEELDSLLSGVPAEGITNPIKIKADDWQVQPKDYTLYGIKFINKYDGIYLRRGEDKIVGQSINESLQAVGGVSTGVVLESEIVNIDTTSVYRADFVVRDETTKLKTTGRNSALYTNKVRRAGLPSEDNISIILTFDENNDITITDVEGDNFIVTGSGKFVEDGDEWGGEPRGVIYLQYQYSDVNTAEQVVAFGTKIERSVLDLTHTVNDTLVVRDRDVKFEEFTLELTK
ncbi:DUF5627 domain-containing protein [Tamlana crocina]|uniref:DUF1735 domain-containing protein n=1 Tax=Tamlana crocina TaxID=393006 RepID=A0ABX1D7U2_9FLAO|nr:DUF5627 domain-containing protein [Tamlana crocina]NJX14330.1 DUF1735 domain-containing protein [Tamlana crocina]